MLRSRDFARTRKSIRRTIQRSPAIFWFNFSHPGFPINQDVGRTFARRPPPRRILSTRSMKK